MFFFRILSVQQKLLRNILD
uniref:Uncharacterized protein n=1 Tax=Rhizophora mucronata TaxID=61149 RepID=A0A2P2Q2D8_RHIMU